MSTGVERELVPQGLPGSPCHRPAHRVRSMSPCPPCVSPAFPVLFPLTSPPRPHFLVSLQLYSVFLVSQHSSRTFHCLSPTCDHSAFSPSALASLVCLFFSLLASPFFLFFIFLFIFLFLTHLKEKKKASILTPYKNLQLPKSCLIQFLRFNFLKYYKGFHCLSYTFCSL